MSKKIEEQRDSPHEKGHGTTFNPDLPASREEASRAADVSRKLHFGKETLLVIGDEETIVDVTKELVEFPGYRVLTAGSGSEALEIFQRLDLVILDRIMPGMGGSETFEELKGLRPDVRVILSGGNRLNGRAAGIPARACQAFLQKPFLIADWSRLVRDVLDRKQKAGRTSRCLRHRRIRHSRTFFQYDRSCRDRRSS